MNFEETILMLHLQLSFYFFSVCILFLRLLLPIFYFYYQRRVPQSGWDIWSKGKELSKVEQRQGSLTPAFA